MRLIYIPFIFLFVFSASAQKTNFYAKTDARKIIEGSYLQVEFVLENGRAGNFEPPAFKNFKLVSGPSRSTSTKIVNGYRTQSMSFGYGIQAIKAGHYEIKPATITANAWKYLTVLSIRVNKFLFHINYILSMMCRIFH